MNSTQSVLAHIAKEAAGEFIGGLENVLLDFEEGTDEYNAAQHDLAAGHDALVSAIVAEVKNTREAVPHLKFAGNDFLQQYVSRLLTKWGY